MKREVNRLTDEKKTHERESEEVIDDDYEEAEEEINVEQEALIDVASTPLIDQPKFDCSKCKELKKKLMNQQKKMQSIKKTASNSKKKEDS